MATNDDWNAMINDPWFCRNPQITALDVNDPVDQTPESMHAPKNEHSAKPTTRRAIAIETPAPAREFPGLGLGVRSQQRARTSTKHSGNKVYGPSMHNNVLNNLLLDETQTNGKASTTNHDSSSDLLLTPAHISEQAVESIDPSAAKSTIPKRRNVREQGSNKRQISKSATHVFDSDAEDGAPKPASTPSITPMPEQTSHATSKKKARKRPISEIDAKTEPVASIPKKRTKRLQTEERLRKESDKIIPNSEIPSRVEDMTQADRLLVSMHESGSSWDDIIEAWSALTGLTPARSTLPNRYIRIKQAQAPFSQRDDELLLRAKRGIEDAFDREKWVMIAEAMAKLGSGVAAGPPEERGAVKFTGPILKKRFEDLLAEKNEDDNDEEFGVGGGSGHVGFEESLEMQDDDREDGESDADADADADVDAEGDPE